MLGLWIRQKNCPGQEKETGLNVFAKTKIQLWMLTFQQPDIKCQDNLLLIISKIQILLLSIKMKYLIYLQSKGQIVKSYWNPSKDALSSLISTTLYDFLWPFLLRKEIKESLFCVPRVYFTDWTISLWSRVKVAPLFRDSERKCDSESVICFFLLPHPWVHGHQHF